jgi:Na+-driven multidrug efflux pump
MLSEDIQANEFETKNINQLFFKYGFVTLAGMLAQCVMVMLEAIITGNGLGAVGLATISIIMPLELVNDAIGTGLGIGISTIAAQYKGQGNDNKARKIWNDGFWFTLIFSVILALLIAIFADPVATALGAKGTVKEMATQFIRVFMISYPFCFVGQIGVPMLRVDEKPGMASWITALAAVIAISELYWGIFIAHIGIIASAIYYGLSISLFCISFIPFLNPNNKYHLSFDFKFNWKDLNQAIILGMPFVLITLSSAVYNWVMNLVLGSFGNNYDIAAFGLMNGYIFYVLNMITTSLMQGMQPIASDNYGAKLTERLSQLLKISILSNIVVVAILTVIFAIFARPITSIFTTSSKIVNITASSGLTVVGLTALGSNVNMMSGYYEATGQAGISTFLGILKFLLCASPIALLLAYTVGIKGIWYAQPLADIISFVVAMIFLTKVLQKNKKDVKS